MNRYRPTEKMKREYIERISKMSNQELLDEAYYTIQGDDHDGCTSPMGDFEIQESNKELTKRLKEIGFLNE
jgi:hypothetical protein